MSFFHFPIHKCSLCGNLTQYGSYCGGLNWICLFCLDSLAEDAENDDCPF